MNEEYKINDDTKTKILYASPMVLPSSPSKDGLSASQIKSYFYKFINEIIKAVNNEFSKITDDLDETDKKIDDTLESHNANTTAHSNIISSLNNKDTELGNAIESKVSKVEGKVLSTNDFNNTYKAMLDNLDNILYDKLTSDDISISNDSTGLTYTITVKDKSLNINIPKDQFLKNASYDSESHKLKFTFETSAGEKEVDVDLADLADIYTAGDGLTLDNGVFNIDSSIARTSALLNYIQKSDFEALEEMLDTKENKRSIIECSSENVTLESGKEYNCGIRTSLILNLPETINDCFECIVNFKSGATIPTFDTDARIIYTQDDTLDGLLYPLSNKIYEINIKSVMGKLIAIVNATECEVIS